MARKSKPGTLGATFRAARASAFVGREEEQSRFRAALERTAPAILWVFAPGGTGKSALLRKLGEIARKQGASCVAIDLSTAEASPAAILGEIEKPLARSERAVLLVDSYERGIAIDGWVRETLLPALPEDVILVIASRNAPSVEWRTDPGAGSLLRSLELGPLDEETSRALLVTRGVVEDRADELVGMAHGHALALVLLAEVLRSTGRRAPSSLREVPEVVTELVARLVREIQSAEKRRALELCAHARRTTEDLLQAMIAPGPAHELMTWLRGLPYVSSHRDGVALHPIVRDAIDEDSRWRDPPGYRALHLGLARHLTARVQAATGSERERTFLDLLYLRRVNEAAHRAFDFDTLGSGWAEVPRPEEREAVAALIEAHEGPEGARIARYWFDRQREAFTVLRAPLGDPMVVSMHLVLGEIPAEARQIDPALEEIHRFMEARDGFGEGRRVVVTRFLAGRDPSSDGRLRHHRPMLLWLTMPRVAFAVTALSDGARWEKALAEVGHRREGAFAAGGRPAPIFVGDFRAQPPSEWLLGMLTRDVDGAAMPDEPARADEAGLDRRSFGAALQHALENFTRSDQLQGSALLRSRWARHGAGAEPPSPQVLRRLIREAVTAMTEHPRDARLARALEAAFLHPAPSREAAAERIDVPFSTFRRHLAKGIERLEEILWSSESGSGT